MAKLRLGMAVSLDGYVCDQNGDSSSLYSDLEQLRHTSYMQEEIEDCGAVLMGRHAYDMANGDLSGYEFQVPIFVVTHHPPAETPKGQNDKLTVTFVSNLDEAVEKAKKAAKEKYVISMGGASIAHQLLNCGYVDELQIDIMPTILRDGLRFIDDVSIEKLDITKIGIREVGERTSIRFKVA